MSIPMIYTQVGLQSDLCSCLGLNSGFLIAGLHSGHLYLLFRLRGILFDCSDKKKTILIKFLGYFLGITTVHGSFNGLSSHRRHLPGVDNPGDHLLRRTPQGPWNTMGSIS